MIKTNRLNIRPYEQGDEEAIYGVINSQGIFETTLNIPYPYPREQLKIWLHFIMKNSLYKRGYEYGIFKKDHTYIGNVGIVNIDWVNHHAEITYFIGEEYWGQGYATEAVRAMIRFAFQELGLERIQGRCMVINPASLRVMQKCGLKYEGKARHEVIKSGNYMDVWHTAILKKDFLATEERDRE